MCGFIIQVDTVVFCMPGDLAITGDVGFQHPIGTMCLLGLSLPAYIVRGTFVLSALQCLWVLLHGHFTDHHFFWTVQIF